MSNESDAELLEQFARSQSEAAFAALVQRHIALVHSVASRHTANPQQAEDITQAVFIILARKAASLSPKTVLPGWLYHTARLTAANLQRAETRRIRREQEAFMQSTMQESATDTVWRELSPLLDDAMADLRATDRDAIVLRFFQNQSLSDVGAAMGIAERAAQKRVNRALEKLRAFFSKRGVVSTTAIIAGAISSNSVQAAPPALANSVTALALAKGATASTSTLTLIKGALKVMARTKAKTAIVAGAVILLAAGTTTVSIKAVQRLENHDDQWDIGRINSGILQTAPHIVRIIPSKFPNQDGWAGEGNGRILGLGDPVDVIIGAAYGYYAGARTIYLTKLPPGKYDFIANLPTRSNEALKQEIEKQFGVIGRDETIETNAFILRVETTDAPGLQPSKRRNNSSSSEYEGAVNISNQQIQSLINCLESNLGIPVINQTGLKKRYDFHLKWNAPDDAQHTHLKQALTDQLGLELIPANMPVQMLVVEKAD